MESQQRCAVDKEGRRKQLDKSSETINSRVRRWRIAIDRVKTFLTLDLRHCCLFVITIYIAHVTQSIRTQPKRFINLQKSPNRQQTQGKMRFKVYARLAINWITLRLNGRTIRWQNKDKCLLAVGVRRHRSISFRAAVSIFSKEKAMHRPRSPDQGDVRCARACGDRRFSTTFCVTCWSHHQPT